MTEEKSSTTEDENMTPEQRMKWLRERGIEIVTPEERKAAATAATNNNGDKNNNQQGTGDPIEYVLIPADPTKPMEQRSFIPSTPNGTPIALHTSDALADHLKIEFAGNADKVDLSLLQQQGSGEGLLGSQGTPASVSEEALRNVAAQGNVEIFNLVHATESNQYTGISIYLDELGMLKRLPINTRAIEYATRAGFHPPPQFYGDVFLGRVKRRPILQNLSLKLGKDTALDANWLQKATNDNLQYQMEMNRITGRNDTQPMIDGQDGKEKTEDGYSWTQTEEECEIIIPLPVDATSKDIQVKFKSRQIEVHYQKELKLLLNIFERIDVDSGTWTIEQSINKTNLVISIEKADAALWPRIEN